MGDPRDGHGAGCHGRRGRAPPPHQCRYARPAGAARQLGGFGGCGGHCCRRRRRRPAAVVYRRGAGASSDGDGTAAAGAAFAHGGGLCAAARTTADARWSCFTRQGCKTQRRSHAAGAHPIAHAVALCWRRSCRRPRDQPCRPHRHRQHRTCCHLRCWVRPSGSPRRATAAGRRRPCPRPRWRRARGRHALGRHPAAGAAANPSLAIGNQLSRGFATIKGRQRRGLASVEGT